jgi:UDP-GlcNAc:undecaprenyl-phosphate/decaprenyl-phosphate GlcNAc-1-phosphate transferase
LTHYALTFFAALVVSFALTPLMAAIARRAKAVDYPGGRHIHQAPTPRFGGAAIFGGIVGGLVLASYASSQTSELFSPVDLRSVILVISATMITIMGLLDDRHSLSAGAKLAAELFIAACVVTAGYRIQLISVPYLGWMNPAISVLWIASVMNALNMIDGLDGLAAGVSLTIALGLFCQSLYFHNERHALILMAVSGAILGFLPFNFHRARIFLGDSGSLLLGLLLAVAAVQGPSEGYVARTAVIPIIALGLPLAELFLTVGRRLLREFLVVKRDDQEQQYGFVILARPKLFTADGDHMHHRLLNRGMRSTAAVLLFYSISAALVTVAVVGAVERWRLGYLLIFFAAALFAGVHFFGYSDLQPLRKGVFLPVLGRLLSAPTPVFIAYDLAFASVSLLLTRLFYGTRAYIFGGEWPLHIQLLRAGALIGAQMLGLAIGGLYRQPYSVIGYRECVIMLRSVGFSFALGVGVFWSLGPRSELAAVVLDGYLLATFIIGLRLSFSILDHIFQHPQMRRVLIYGADERASGAANAMRANPELRLIPVGFIDNEPGKRARWFRGLRVYRISDLSLLMRGKVVDEVFVPFISRNGASASIEALSKDCSTLGLPLSTYADHSEHPLENGEGNGEGGDANGGLAATGYIKAIPELPISMKIIMQRGRSD